MPSVGEGPVGRIVYLAFSRNETPMGSHFPGMSVRH
jgi:hypothetical protein